MENRSINTPCTRLAAALHGACVALDEARTEASMAAGISHGAEDHAPAVPGAHWTDKVGRHVALAVAALPDSVLRAWLLDGQTIGGAEIYRTLKAGAGVRAGGKDQAAA